MSSCQIIGAIRMVRSCVRHMQAKVTLHQISVKLAKEKRAISQEVLATCRQRAREKIPQLLDEMKDDLSLQLRYRLPSTKPISPLAMRRFWIELRAQLNPKSNLVFIIGSKTPAKNMVKYLQLVWTEMGLPGRPNFIDIRSAVATHAKNFHTPEILSRLSAMMCHDMATADKFYVKHLNKEQSLEIKVAAEPKSEKRKRLVCVSESSSSEEGEVPYQESGSSALEEEMEELRRLKRRLAKRTKKQEGDGEEDDDDDDDEEEEQEQGEKDQQEEEEEQQQEEEQQEEEDQKERDFLTLFIFTLCNSS
ncbi:hypothetical protein CRENBAI_007448, partial [Crenichthys baileyi]